MSDLKHLFLQKRDLMIRIMKIGLQMLFYIFRLNNQFCCNHLSSRFHVPLDLNRFMEDQFALYLRFIYLACTSAIFS